MQEIVDLLAKAPAGAAGTAGTAGTAGIAALQDLVSRWAERWPSVQQPSADPCLTVIHVRQLLLNALTQEWPRSLKHEGQTLHQVHSQSLRSALSVWGPCRCSKTQSEHRSSSDGVKACNIIGCRVQHFGTQCRRSHQSRASLY